MARDDSSKLNVSVCLAPAGGGEMNAHAILCRSTCFAGARALQINLGGDSELLASSHEDFSEPHGLREQERRKDEGDGVLRIKGGT